MSKHSTAEDATSPISSKVIVVCRHCGGSGREPGPLRVEFARKGPLRGRQQELAEATGISAPMISRIFAGEVAPGALNLMKLAQALHVTVDRILALPAVRRKVQEQD